MPPEDEVELLELLRAADAAGVHLVCAAGPAAVAAAAIVSRALARAGRKLAGLTVLGYGEPADSPVTRRWLAGAPALLRIGLGDGPPLLDGARELAIDGARGEPLAARAFRMAAAVTQVGDACWCAAVGLIRAEPSHVLVERAIARCARVELEHIAELLDGAARSPEPAALSLMAAEMLASASEPRGFLASVQAGYLQRAHAHVRAELARVARVRPRPGFCSLVVEYESDCRVEDLVAACWRGLRPGTSVLVANHGAVDGGISVFADGAMTVVARDEWAARRERLGVETALATA